MACSNDHCQSEKQLLQNEYNALQEEIKRSSIKYHELLISNVKKDLKIRELKARQQDLRFSEFKSILSQQHIDEIKRVDGSSKKDSYFLVKVLRGLYENELDKLQMRTYSGRSKDGKKALTPEKVESAKKIFHRRLEILGSHALNRKQNFGQHCKNAIKTINSSLKK